MGKRAAGILMPISSLPSDYGIGCFSKSTYEFVDWLKEAGQTYWQILPLGPTSYGDSPYQSFSTFAGNPYFIDLDTLVEEGVLDKKDCEKVNWGKKLDDVDYERLLQIRKATVKFHVQPYKYLKDESKVSLSITTQTSVEVENKGLEVSKPIFMLEGSGTIEIAVNGINIFKYTFPNGENKVIVDSLKEEAYLEGVYKNRNMLGEFPKLEVGNNTISWTGTLTKIEIEPKSRWL